MNSYQPDRWVIVEIDGLRKVLAAWIGGYLNADEWRLSSGIQEITEDDVFFIIKNYSGSVYKCNKKLEGMTFLSSSIYRDIKQQCEDQDKKLTLISLTNKKGENEE
jgi:hypothetical protein